MSDLSAEAVAAVDERGMLADVLGQHAHLEDARWRFESAGAARVDVPGGLVVCGIGGSAIGAEIARACVGGRAERPIRVMRGSAPEPWLADDALVMLASYSGETAETLACYDAVARLGAPRIAITTGGALAERARSDGVPVIGVPAGFAPRAAIAYMTVGALEAAALCGAAPSLAGELQAAAGVLERLAAEWGPDEESAEPKRIARALQGTLPVVYGEGSTAAVARRWKTQLNENAKLPAFAAELPEANHNEVCGFAAAPGLAPLAPVFLEQRRGDSPAGEAALAERAASDAGLASQWAAGRGQTLVERVLSLVLLGDLTSVYLAALRGVDPTPIAAIDELKRRRAGQSDAAPLQP